MGPPGAQGLSTPRHMIHNTGSNPVSFAKVIQLNYLQNTVARVPTRPPSALHFWMYYGVLSYAITTKVPPGKKRFQNSLRRHRNVLISVLLFAIERSVNFVSNILEANGMFWNYLMDSARINNTTRDRTCVLLIFGKLHTKKFLNELKCRHQWRVLSPFLNLKAITID